MQQQVNLYQPATRPGQKLLAARSAALGLLAISTALLALWGFGLWQLHGLRTAVAVVRDQRAAQEAMEAAQTAQLGSLSQEELDQLATELAAAVASKSQALTLLQTETASSAAFSARLAALAARHIDGLWLDHVTLGARRDTMSLSGGALTPDLVPLYLQSLASDPALSGGQIDNFVIDRPTEPDPHLAPHLRFRAATRDLPVPERTPEQS